MAVAVAVAVGASVVVLGGCGDGPAPQRAKVALPLPELTPAPPRERPVPPEGPESIAAFPDTPADRDATNEGRLLQALLFDPVAAEKALDSLENPDAWRAALMASFAARRGEKSFEVDPEPALPPAEPGDGPALQAGAQAWLAVDQAPLWSGGKQRKVLATLPLHTPVEVVSLTADEARVAVAIAQSAVWAESGSHPARVVTRRIEGRVARAALGPEVNLEALLKRAVNQADDAAGRLAAVVLWEQGWRMERSARTREGWLRAAWAARRASSVVRAAFAHDLAPARGLRFAWACTGAAPPTAKWLEVGRTPPKVTPPNACLWGPGTRAHCPGEGASALKLGAWLTKQHLAPQPWLRFTVDARSRRQVFLVTTPLEAVDACDDFLEVSFEAGSGVVRRLALPLGTGELEVWVPVTRHQGVDYSVAAAASEGQAVSWLRTKENHRWTLDALGQLEPSLGTEARAFEVPADFNATSLALPPGPNCECAER